MRRRSASRVQPNSLMSPSVVVRLEVPVISLAALFWALSSLFLSNIVMFPPYTVSQ